MKPRPKFHHIPLNLETMQFFKIKNKYDTEIDGNSEAYLNNWLVNLTGKINGFKEIDLLQEHQNFWAKVIYNARGSNRSWDWLSMITVVIFNLRDVMRNVQTQFKIPHHGISHTSPNAAEDISKLQGWLESNTLQTYVKERPGKDKILRVRDLMVTGAAYANTPGAFKNFRRETRKVSYKQTLSVSAESESDEEDEAVQDETERELDEVDQDDLLHDDEEFTTPPIENFIWPTLVFDV
ncbi:hypothetical protein B0H10DRAFT_1971319 [Mycena sp. CBHHK59/15]|nr:hypothetical protein B0H10DRAFT_1971319 [Mycena sp. CBHHK59/15]